MTSQPLPVTGRYLVAIDGGYLSHVSDYYKYQHYLQSRLDLLALRRFIRCQMASLLALAPENCHEERCAYFRGRLPDAMLHERGRFHEQRTFETVLSRQGFECHWVPVNPVGDRWREKGCDVALAVTVMDQVFKFRPEGLCLVAGGGDNTPLLHLLQQYQVKVMVLAWHLQYRASEPGRSGQISVSTSRRLCAQAQRVLQMDALIEAGLSSGLPQIQDLFLPPRPVIVPARDSEPPASPVPDAVLPPSGEPAGEAAE